MRLYSYWRSTTSYRVRAALNLKGISYEIVPVDLVAGDQRSDAYRKLNPGEGVPLLELDDGTVLSQSLAIIDYLDAVYPEPPLIPTDPIERARVLAVAHTVALDIHPVNNLRVGAHLRDSFGASPEQVAGWMRHWMQEGFAALEALIPGGHAFAFGDAPNLADLCIFSQAYNARRWGVDLAPFPVISRIERACLAVPAIADARPELQPDAKVLT
ncbi:maleylacetoacetate isomerase [Rhizobiaceae bacterium]|nr:maleylacetoacetate isomerase [Rhizobiaceae bacterium]